MARDKTVYRCGTCGADEPKWAGRCGTCGEWNTLEEHVVRAAAAMAAVSPLVVGADRPPRPITEIEVLDGRPDPTGIGELDRVLGGGLVPGSVTLLGGEPGVGKSTLVLQLLAQRARRGGTALYVTGEESPQQVSLRAQRLDAMHERILLAPETSLPGIISRLHSVRPGICVVDSVQTLFDPASSSAPGSLVQVRDCVHELVTHAKLHGTTMVLVGHVTKEGALAGPRVLEHVVDTVLSMEGDRHHDLRVVRATKHRFGSTQEIGLFSLGADGLESVPDASGMFLSDRRPGIPGSVVTPAIEGHRPLLVEVQALVAPSALAQPRRSAKGLDSGRLSLLLAVLERRAGLPIAGLDVYAMAVGGVRVLEPGVDLALCLALASSLTGRPVPAGLVACGEVGLGGELRRVGRLEQRLSEAARLGFTSAVVPSSAPADFPGIEVLRMPALETALTLFDLL